MASRTLTFGVRMADYMRDKIDQYDIMHDNQTLCYGMLDVRDMGLPVVGTIHHPITKDRRIDIAHAKWPWIKFLKWRWYSFLNMQIKVARALDPLIVVSEAPGAMCIQTSKYRWNAWCAFITALTMSCSRPTAYHATQKPPDGHRQRRCAPQRLIYLIRAYHMLLADHPDLELVVVGRCAKARPWMN